MREVESEDGSLAALGLWVSKLTHLEKAQVDNLRATRGFGLYCGDVSPMGNTVKKFLMADLVVYRAPLSFNS